MESESDNLPDLTPSDVIGQRLVAIYQVCTLNDEKGHDWTYTFFHLENGVTFALPIEDANGLCLEPIPHDAVTLKGLEGVLGQRITGLLRPAPNTDILAESLYVSLENGYLVTNVVGGWSGTDATGLYVFKPGQFDMRDFIPIWNQ